MNKVTIIKVLRKEVEVLTKRLKPAGTGYLITAIDVINGRIDELIGAAIDENPGQVRDLTSEIYGEDVYDGFAEHTEAMEQARLRKIQDTAAGRSNEEVEHTKEYYDRNRNRAMEGEDFHLEPLPINTFK